MAICVECEWFNDIPLDTCDNRDLPVTDFIHGRRNCHILNPKGDCKGFKSEPEPESIYELKSDEDLVYRGPLLPEKEHHDFRDKDEN